MSKYTFLPSAPGTAQSGSPPSATFPPTRDNAASTNRIGNEIVTKLFALFPRPTKLVFGSTVIFSIIFMSAVWNFDKNDTSLSIPYFLPPPSPLLQHFAYQRELPPNEFLRPVEYEKRPGGLYYPPEVYPAALNPYVRANAAFVSLVRNNEQEGILKSMRDIEDRVNRKFGVRLCFATTCRALI